MAKLYTLKTTATLQPFSFPSLGIYVNQEFYDRYKDEPNGYILEKSGSGITQNYFRDALMDKEFAFAQRKIYYNTYSEKNQRFENNQLEQCLRSFGNVILLYDGSNTESQLLYNGRAYGDAYGFQTTPGQYPGGYRISDFIYLGGTTPNVSQDPYFGGYYCSGSYSSNNYGYEGASCNIKFHVFPENIIDENGNFDLNGKKGILVVLTTINDGDRVGYQVYKGSTLNMSEIVNYSLFNNAKPQEDTGAPYDNGPTSDTGGGNGTFDGTSDIIGVPSLPSLSALDTGFVKMWRPTKTQLKDIYNYMWSSAFDIESFKKIFANPIETIMGFGIIPIAVSVGTAEEFKVGNIGTGVNVTPITEQFYEFSCGTLNIQEQFGSYLDYEPYTTFDLYLPYVGNVRLSTDDILRQSDGSLEIVYHIDILNGACVVYVLCNNSVAYQFNGNVLTQLPITGNDFRGMFSSILGIAGNLISAANSVVSGHGGSALGDVASAANNAMGLKPSINRSGSISSSCGFLGVQTPYLIINRPNISRPANDNTYLGFPSNITRKISSLHGYTEFEKIYIENIPATDNELNEIKSLLESGVVL